MPNNAISLGRSALLRVDETLRYADCKDNLYCFHGLADLFIFAFLESLWEDHKNNKP